MKEKKECVFKEKGRGGGGGKKSKGEAFKNRLHWQSKKTTDVDLIESSTLCGAPKSQSSSLPFRPIEVGVAFDGKEKMKMKMKGCS